MSYERDDYVRRQEAEHEMIRMRQPPRPPMTPPTELDTLRAENAAKDATIARLAEALEPFVAIEHATVERAKTLGYKDGNAAIPVPRKFLRDAALANRDAQGGDA